MLKNGWLVRRRLERWWKCNICIVSAGAEAHYGGWRHFILNRDWFRHSHSLRVTLLYNRYILDTNINDKGRGEDNAGSRSWKQKQLISWTKDSTVKLNMSASLKYKVKVKYKMFNFLFIFIPIYPELQIFGLISALILLPPGTSLHLSLVRAVPASRPISVNISDLSSWGRFVCLRQTIIRMFWL